MEKQKTNDGWSKATMVLGIISVIFAILPLISAWFMFLTAINYLLSPIGIICGVIAIIKSQNVTKSIVGLVLCILAICAPLFLAEYYLDSTVDSVSNILDIIEEFQ